MRLEINRLEGLRNDLCLRLDRAEIDSVVLSISDRDRLMTLPGIPRHRDTTPDEHKNLSACRIPIDAHLRKLGVLDESGTLRKRAVAIQQSKPGHESRQCGVAARRNAAASFASPRTLSTTRRTPV